MKELEQALRRGRPRDVSEGATRGARAVAQRAADEGVLDVAYVFEDTPVGRVMLAATRRGLIRLAYTRSASDAALVEELADKVSPRVIESSAWFDAIRTELDDYFEGRRTSFDLPLDWTLTGGFMRRVLQKTARIPYGNVSTYREVAERAGSPRAARAAGNALGANPIAIVVPCHRVLHSGGGLGGYGGGLEVKEFLLRLEGVMKEPSFHE
jgi:methylated-DNA-[protein]-cysteine S-methyltransferase